ncbi:hypothetical protein TELCIR_11147 [Teladorsagia circumcincta]|uniref:Uncharacterized protein n=1 Tax=Teladorsagia circumcincta TaxID=45464 RepID=A0A2G9UA17_TELCI|nr:hypothetical protein TELCIR_11147 [Teladorsagia circumcincta]
MSCSMYAEHHGDFVSTRLDCNFFCRKSWAQEDDKSGEAFGTFLVGIVDKYGEIAM